ncbi:kinase-like domain-containing protein [Thamnocephalis sphaerospora]|uniref:Kinase-like domain-containing protein n=1 Tax=Thamnocephalis sphaerospora TaxID=78915 RepID=A0A4P9XMT2_9FUNG|nr:kinase-like domain-containing protein [Thamnocephalis sphaerospora]|eukprot:RKP06701.1 kinase-like domain-containing protein [Thamnocephalis sphaerospora]
MSDSPMFSSGGTGVSTGCLFGPQGGGDSRYSFSQSAELAAQSSSIPAAMAGQPKMHTTASEYVMLGHSLDDHVQATTQGFDETQEVNLCDMDEDGDEADDELGSYQAPTLPPWGTLLSINPDYPTLQLVKDDQPGSAKGGYMLGRHRECDFIFESPLISNRHCLIYKVNERVPFGLGGATRIRVFVEDLSSNGTYINGEKLGRGNRRELVHGDELQLAVWSERANIPYFHDKFFIYQKAITSDPSACNKSIHDHYILTRVLGSGNFAEVKLAVQRNTGDKYAVKILDKGRFIRKPKLAANIDQEISILMSIDHPCAVRIVDVFDDLEELYLVLELAAGGELFDRIVNKSRFSEPEARIIFLQLFHAIKYLHDRGVTHRDLKPENILMMDDHSLRLKISDFGLAKIVDDETFLHTLCGTPNYVAPEVLHPLCDRNYTKAVDMWSCGVILYICLCGYPPFSDQLAPPCLKDQIRQGMYKFPPEHWKEVSDDAIDLVEWLLTVNPDGRATVEQALSHPWMQQADLSVGGLDDAFIARLRSDQTEGAYFRREPTAMNNSEATGLSSLASQFSQMHAASLGSFAHVDPNSLSVLSDGVERVPVMSHAFTTIGPLTPGNGTADRRGIGAAGGSKRDKLISSNDSADDIRYARGSAKRVRHVPPSWK